MHFAIIILASIVGTILMTAFSQLLAVLTGHKFNEAHLLNALFNNAVNSNSDISKNDIRGWSIHLLIGLIMVLGLWVFYHFDICGKNLLTGVILGFFAGIIGVIGWSVLFYLHDTPPKINLTYFYIQLIFAHVVFSITVFALFRFFY
ncbi:hypothetical protein B0O79_0396 [Flavobacteriaceae bacterium MAR_2009_75]|nr:hypothetical protein B0O79_0396 [Flavobacteriaceae bacterium MAR_2009_75]